MVLLQALESLQELSFLLTNLSKYSEGCKKKYSSDIQILRATTTSRKQPQPLWR